MQTRLGGGANGRGSGGDSDYTPLLITSTDDLVLPISAGDGAGEDGKAGQSQARWRRSREAVTKFLDTLTRTSHVHMNISPSVFTQRGLYKIFT